MNPHRSSQAVVDRDDEYPTAALADLDLPDVERPVAVVEDEPPARGRRWDALASLLIGTGIFSLYVTVQYGDFLGWDGRTMANVAHNILDHHSLMVTPDVAWYVPQFGGASLSPFGIGLSLLLVPFWFVQRSVDPTHGYFLTLANPLVLALAAVVVFRIGLLLGWRRTTAVLTALAAGAVTVAPVYSIELFNEPAISLCLVSAIWGLLQLRDGRMIGAWVLGAAAGAACLFRYDSFLLIAPVVAAVPFFVDRRTLRRNWLRWLLPLAVPGIIAVVWTLWYNVYRSGDPMGFSPGGEFTTPLLEGLERQLLSPGRGFFWYNPLLIAAIPGIWFLWRRNRALAVLIPVLFLTRAAYFAQYWNPDGSVAWGPRYLAPMAFVLAIALGECIERVRSLAGRGRVAARAALVALALAGATVTFAGVWVNYTYTIQHIFYIPGWEQMPGEELNALKEERARAQFDDWLSSPIAVHLSHLDEAGFYPEPGFALKWWEGGPSPVGVASLGLALGASAAAVRTAAAGDRHGSARSGPRVERQDRPVAAGG